MLYTKEIEKNEHFDIVVIGGGVAGFCAAVAAGRMGKRVALIEDMGALGGIMTTGGNPQIGIFFAYYKQAIAGIGWELCKNLEAMGFADIPDFTTVDTRKGSEPSNVKVCMPMAEAEMNRMCREAGVALFFHSKLIDVAVENGTVKQAIVAEKGGLRAFSADIFIDCTGDGDLSALAGADFELSETLQPGTLGYTFRVNHAETLDKDELQAKFKEKWERGEILHGDHWPAYHAPIIGYFKAGGCNSNHIVMNSTTAEGMTQAEIEGREKMARMLKFAKENSEISIFSTAAYAAPRESRRITCDMKMSVEDFLTGRLYPDSVCYGYYNIDLHSYSKNAAFEKASGKLPEGVVPNVTYRAMCVKGFDNLLVAGRCACADRETMSALRVKSSCMAMGQVVGTAAALCTEGKVRSVDMTLLKKTLTENGAIVPDSTRFAPVASV